ncbi:MAG: transglycosylase SLT domain-containing protein [Candidatus Promineifilaceae bacterium]
MAFYDEPMQLVPVATPFTRVARLPAGQFRGQIDPMHKRMALALTFALAVGFALLSFNPASQPASAGSESRPQTLGASAGSAAVGSGLAPIFTPEVLFWTPKILQWAAAHGLDPNLVAIIIQVESCGDPQAVSSAGAQGLFQVMPFHFEAGEQTLDPDTNAHRGLSYFVDRLAQTSGDIGRSFAGYNGGHVAAGGQWDSWAAETQRYFTWTTGLYQDIQAGTGSSPTLEAWLQAGGASLCRQAAARLGLR